MKLFIHFFFPTQKNKHKAWLLQTKVLVPLTLALVVLNGLASFTYLTHEKVKGSTTDLTPSQVIALTNLERSKANVQLVKPNSLLSTAAQKKADSMIAAGVFEHYYENEGDIVNPWQFILESGYDYFHAGENLGKDFTQSTTLVQAWMDSPTHRENLLNPDYTEIGVAVVQGPYLDKEETTLIVQLFATPVSAVNLEEQSFDSSSRGSINVAPLLEQDKSWAQILVREYPIILFGATFSVVLLIGLTLLIDMEASKKKARLKEVSIDLWNH